MRSFFGVFSFFLFLVIAFASTVYGQPPTIISFSPLSGNIGALVTISGTGFSSTATQNIVYFGGVKATVTDASSSSLTVKVPAGPSYSPITVTNGRLTGYSRIPFLVTFENSTPFDSTAVASKVTVETEEQPQVIVSADFDGDGKPDLAIGHSFHDTATGVSVYRNTNSSGSISSTLFVKQDEVRTEVSPALVTTADFNGDGKLDMAVIETDVSGEQVFRNASTAGNIAFDDSVYLQGGLVPEGVAVGDINGDGLPDFAIACYGSDLVSIFINTSTGDSIRFAPEIDLQTGQGPNQIVLGDFNGDGKLDIAISEVIDGTISFFRNTSSNGLLTFNFRASINAGIPDINWLAAADLNGDGKLDLIAGDRSNDSIAVFRNTGTGVPINYAPKVSFPTGRWPGAVAFGDITGNGTVDVAVENTADSTLSIFRNMSSGGTINLETAAKFFVGAFPRGITVADLDGDGKPEIMSTSSDSTITIFRNSLGEATNVQQLPSLVPGKFKLYQNYPNPFNPMTMIQFTVPSTGRTVLKIFNVLGQEVATLFDGEAAAGTNHQVQFNASALASGIYFSRLEFEGELQMKKMLLLK